MTPPNLDAFLARWLRSGGGEMANSQTYLSELCDLLGVTRPDPKQPDETKNDYVFERMLSEDVYGVNRLRRIDLYKRDAFILESKQGSNKETAAEPFQLLAGPGPAVRRGIGVRGSDTWDAAMRRAKVQAEQYGKILPPGHVWPPFLVIVDVGYCIELWANFARDGKAYTQFPDRNHFRIFHDEADAKGAPTLRDAKARALLAQVWQEPMALDPSRHSAQVTRDIAKKLAELAKSFDSGPNDATSHWQAKDASGFLMRCLFCMFAEDVGLLPERAFRDLLEGMRGRTEQFVPMLSGLWREMDKGTPFSTILRKGPVREFNGKFFHDQTVLQVNDVQLEYLIDAAKADWAHVEPAIFGTLLERALSVTDRHKLGAHYTPRSYVERLVIPTVIEPLRADWLVAQQEADYLLAAGQRDKAYDRLMKYHQDLRNVKVLDPACGSGNFLYVTLEQMKKLEGEVLQRIADFHAQDGAGQIRAREGQDTVHPRQFFGIEVNKRAADVAEMVLWIGYLQWQRRTLSTAANPELREKLESLAVLQDLHNIENRDAVLAWDSRKTKVDADGRPVTVWDGVTMKVSPVTGKEVPDDSKRREVEEIVGARKAEWPAADFVVGNPPFIGNKRMRELLGDGYAEALRKVHADVPETVDFVMYWWHSAAEMLRAAKVRRFGFITTNSITMEFNRKVVQKQLNQGIKLVYAVADHPWVENGEGAAVRVAMTAATSDQDQAEGILAEATEGTSSSDGEVAVTLRQARGMIHPDLRVGANITAVTRLRANLGMCFQGCILIGEGFRLTRTEVLELGLDPECRPAVLKRHRSGKDVVQAERDNYVVDFFGLTDSQAREASPALFQRLYDTVRPARKENRDPQRRDRWWLHGRSNEAMRDALRGLRRYVATVETSKHKPFVFLDASILPDHKLYVVGSDDAHVLGVLSARPHQVWALAAGGRLGVGNDPTWTNGTCYLPFPFPDATPEQQVRIRELAERLDKHRKDRQALHPDLTLTGMYNVLQKLRAGEALTDKDRKIHENGLCSLLKQVHDELDAAVFDAYGWPADLDDEALLQKLVDLNAERADEERRGHVRWLRPEFQDPARKGKAVKTELDLGLPVVEEGDAPAVKKKARPKNPGEAIAAMQEVFAAARAPVTVAEIAAQFDGWDSRGIELALGIAAGYGEVREVAGAWVRG